jgi:DTW domain-containing protein YfiP
MRQRKTKAPCAKCRLHPERCICAQIPNLNLKTKVSLVIHAKELKRTTNSGLLAHHALINSQVIVRGFEKQKTDLSLLLDPGYTPLFFYPTEDAIELDEDFVRTLQKPIHLIVPDGNWRQAGKVRQRHPELNEVQAVKISAKNKELYHLRREHMAEGMSTLQAIALALGFFEGPDVYRSLYSLYEAKLHATLRGRGVKPIIESSGYLKTKP